MQTDCSAINRQRQGEGLPAATARLKSTRSSLCTWSCLTWEERADCEICNCSAVRVRCPSLATRQGVLKHVGFRYRLANARHSCHRLPGRLESNARALAGLLNTHVVRERLADSGINIPESTQFVAALHLREAESTLLSNQAGSSGRRFCVKHFLSLIQIKSSYC